MTDPSEPTPEEISKVMRSIRAKRQEGADSRAGKARWRKTSKKDRKAWSQAAHAARWARPKVDRAELDRRLLAKEITPDEHERLCKA